jgi:hypothetical protein
VTPFARSYSTAADLCDAVSQLRPRRVVPTVNAATPAHRRSLVDRFAHLMDLSTDRSRCVARLVSHGAGIVFDERGGAVHHISVLAAVALRYRLCMPCCAAFTGSCE